MLFPYRLRPPAGVLDLPHEFENCGKILENPGFHPQNNRLDSIILLAT
jgi:hypothetical protein